MVIIVRTFWLAAERALFSWNNRSLWNIFSGQRLFWVVSKPMKVYERMGENDEKDERKTAFLVWAFLSPEAALLLVSTKNRDLRDSRTSRHSAHAQSQDWQISLVLVSMHCVYKVFKTGMSLDLGCFPLCQRFRKFRSEFKWKGPFRFLLTGIFGITSGGGPHTRPRYKYLKKCSKFLSRNSRKIPKFLKKGF